MGSQYRKLHRSVDKQLLSRSERTAPEIISRGGLRVLGANLAGLRMAFTSCPLTNDFRHLLDMHHLDADGPRRRALPQQAQ